VINKLVLTIAAYGIILAIVTTTTSSVLALGQLRSAGLPGQGSTGGTGASGAAGAAGGAGGNGASGGGMGGCHADKEIHGCSDGAAKGQATE
jgi:hypothetical protein